MLISLFIYFLTIYELTITEKGRKKLNIIIIIINVVGIIIIIIIIAPSFDFCLTKIF